MTPNHCADYVPGLPVVPIRFESDPLVPITVLIGFSPGLPPNAPPGHDNLEDLFRDYSDAFLARYRWLRRKRGIEMTLPNITQSNLSNVITAMLIPTKASAMPTVHKAVHTKNGW